MKKQIIFLILASLFYAPIFYVFVINPEFKLPQTSGEFSALDLWLFISPLSGIIMWIWSLYDWGNRTLKKGRKLMWLIILISTFYVGATIYLPVVALKKTDN